MGFHFFHKYIFITETLNVHIEAVLNGKALTLKSNKNAKI